MNCTTPEARSLAEGLRAAIQATPVEVVICPPFTAISTVAEVLRGSELKLGAQNMYFEEKGAFTGEIGPVMLKDLGCRYVILGHSERRRQMGETSELVNRKASMALAQGLVPIVCVGETLDEREAGRTEQVITEQLTGSLAGLSPEVCSGVVLAYEPVWAIGTGRVATPEQAREVHASIRQAMGPEMGQAVRILYGGSVTAENAADLLASDQIDGALVGGASLKADSFAAIVRAA